MTVPAFRRSTSDKGSGQLNGEATNESTFACSAGVALVLPLRSLPRRTAIGLVLLSKRREASNVSRSNRRHLRVLPFLRRYGFDCSREQRMGCRVNRSMLDLGARMGACERQIIWRRGRFES